MTRSRTPSRVGFELVFRGSSRRGGLGDLVERHGVASGLAPQEVLLRR